MILRRIRSDLRTIRRGGAEHSPGDRLLLLELDSQEVGEISIDSHSAGDTPDTIRAISSKEESRISQLDFFFQE